MDLWNFNTIQHCAVSTIFNESKSLRAKEAKTIKESKP